MVACMYEFAWPFARKNCYFVFVMQFAVFLLLFKSSFGFKFCFCVNGNSEG